MGLDGVELIMAVEESFKISLSDEEAGEVRTAGELFGLVLSKLEPAVAAACLTSYTFYKLRAGIAGDTGCARRQLSPKTRTESVLPARARRATWRSLSRAVGLRFPPLVRPRLVALIVLAATLAPLGAAVFVHSAARWLCVLSVVPVFYGGLLVTTPFANRLPKGAETLGALTQTVTSGNFAALADERRRWREGDAWDALSGLIANQVAINRDEVKKESRFAEDLGFSL